MCNFVTDFIDLTEIHLQMYIKQTWLFLTYLQQNQYIW